nr:MAG TPA: hypothetical protein [Caudoviricetes sp.]
MISNQTSDFRQTIILGINLIKGKFSLYNRTNELYRFYIRNVQKNRFFREHLKSV